MLVLKNLTLVLNFKLTQLYLYFYSYIAAKSISRKEITKNNDEKEKIYNRKLKEVY